MAMMRALCLLTASVWSGSLVLAQGVPVTAIAIDPDTGRPIPGGQDGIESERCDTRLAQVHDLAFSPDGKWLAAGGGSAAESGGVEIYAWADQSSQARRYLELADDVVYSVAWSPDGSLLALASLDGSCILLRPTDGEVVRRIRGHSRGVAAVQFLSDGLLVTASIDHTIRVWRVENGELGRTLKNHTAPVMGLALRPGNDSGLPMLASISRDRTVRLWQPTIGRMMRFARLDSRPLSVTWMPDGSRLVVACEDGDVRIIDPDTVTLEHKLRGIASHGWCLAVTADGRRIVVAGAGGEVRQLDVPPSASSANP